MLRVTAGHADHKDDRNPEHRDVHPKPWRDALEPPLVEDATTRGSPDGGSQARADGRRHATKGFDKDRDVCQRVGGAQSELPGPLLVDVVQEPATIVQQRAIHLKLLVLQAP